MSKSKFFFKKSTGVSPSQGAQSVLYDPAILQVEKKLRKLEKYQDMGGEEILAEVEKLVVPERLLYEFSHLVERKIVSGDGAGQAIAFHSACIRIQILVRDDNPDTPQLAVSRSIPEFLQAKFDKKHVALVFNDLVLFWGKENVVVPQQMYEYESLPGLLPVVETVSHRLYCSSVSEDVPIFDKVVKVIVKYNKNYYYSAKRNSQTFVCDVLEALGGSINTFTLSEPMLQLKGKKSDEVPDSFICHEGLDTFVMSKSRSWLACLQADSMEYLQIVYWHFHGEKADCSVPNCQSALLSDISQQRTKLSC